MKVYIVYHACDESHDHLISVHASVQAAEKAIEKLQTVISSGSFYWTEESVQD